jgi:hypothetical protein
MSLSQGFPPSFSFSSSSSSSSSNSSDQRNAPIASIIHGSSTRSSTRTRTSTRTIAEGNQAVQTIERHHPKVGVPSWLSPVGRHVTPLKILWMCFFLIFFGCSNSERVEDRDYAFDTYYPNPNEIHLAEQRAQRYWQKNSQRFKNPTKYLAVNTTSIVQGDVNQDLYSKLINSKTTTGFFETYSSLNASCIMIYDTATNRFVSDLGYASVDLPPRGSVARWAGYTARYIGWG